MQNNPNNQKTLSFNGSVLAHSKVTSVRKLGGLGTITESCSNVDFKRKTFNKDKAREYRKIATKLKERAGEILYKPKEKKQHRVCGCGKCRIDATLPVGVRYNASKEMASYSNLQWCGSVWLCPDCSYRVTQKRKKELAEALIESRKNGFYVSMLTLTVPHYAGDDLRGLLKKMSNAKHKLWSNRDSREYFSEIFGLVGHITATEVKYSDQNGWHPHYHILLVSKKKIADEDVLIQDELYDFWQDKCMKSGLGKPSRKHGLDLKTGSRDEVLADYISKWGLAEEMTQSHQKIGKRNRQSLTVWEILELASMEKSTRDKYSHLFLEYGAAFKNRAQLYWSSGLKELLKVKDVSDEEAANAAEDDQDEIFDQVLELETQDWWAICFYKMRVEFLELIELDILKNGIDTDFLMVKNLLWNLKYPTGFGAGSGGQGGDFPLCERTI